MEERSYSSFAEMIRDHDRQAMEAIEEEILRQAAVLEVFDDVNDGEVIGTNKRNGKLVVVVFMRGQVGVAEVAPGERYSLHTMVGGRAKGVSTIWFGSFDIGGTDRTKSEMERYKWALDSAKAKCME
ncbi:hypothetical protein JKG47_08735 [Acidithiobacillus sp. MC6.1]|nr:hypothetical protein [Acidithiobacillus sp. MC6.1]